MPAFAQSAGGMLTDEQIDVIVRGIRALGEARHALRERQSPALLRRRPGRRRRAAPNVYAHFCASCHGPDGTRGHKASSIVDGSFLALVSDQELRTIVIIGRPELGAPDWRNDVPGKPMSAQEISDVVAWLAAQRPQFPASHIATRKPAGGRPMTLPDGSFPPRACS